MTDLTNKIYHDADAAREHLESVLWPEGPVCPHCNGQSVTKLQGKSTRPGVYKCRPCRKPFSVTVGTVFERSKIALNKWVLAAHLMAASKKGISAHQLHRMLDVEYKTAWFMEMRLREAMKPKSTPPLGSDGGPVEVDETYWGNEGKQKPGARGGDHKMKVLSLVERGGQKRSFHVTSVNAVTLRPILKAQIDAKARLMTDEAAVYTKIGAEFAEHGVVNHSAKEYARGDVTTNTVESSFAILKRGLYGTFHSVSEYHLQRYADEFDFRWNHRVKLGVDDEARAEILLKGAEGKRLMYRQPEGQA